LRFIFFLKNKQRFLRIKMAKAIFDGLIFFLNLQNLVKKNLVFFTLEIKKFDRTYTDAGKLV